MVDYDLFKNILSQSDDGYIENGDIIDNKTFRLLATSPINKMKALFKKGSNSTDPNKYHVQFQCPECNKYYMRTLSFSKMYNYMRAFAGSDKYRESFYCEECQAIIEQRKRERLKEADKEERERIEKATQVYIENYLNPDKQWKRGTRWPQKWEEITQRVNRSKVAEYIKGMSYQDFLNTLYWKTIAEKVKYRSKKCVVCNSEENLNVHHRTYEHHGEELHYMWKDLVCLCKDCHEKYHFE